MPQILMDALGAASFPGQVYRGEKEVFDPTTGHVSDEAVAASAQMAGLVGGTNFVRAAASKVLPAAEEGLVSRALSSYDPIPRPARPFEADYPLGRWPDGSPTDASGRLTHDIEGRPLNPDAAIAGRRLAGGADEALTPEELNAKAAAITGALPLGVAPSALGRGAVGKFVRSHDPETGEAAYQILFGKNLSIPQRDSVVGHEVGHVVDHFTGGIPQDKIKKELGVVYNELNNGNLQNAVRINGGDIDKALAARANNRGMKPAAFGYTTKEAPAELTAEAIRAYMTDPNAMKTMAPKAAAAIREAVNTNPTLSPHIQFNSLAGAGLLGAGALAAGTNPADGAEQAGGAELPKGPSMSFGFGQRPGLPAGISAEDIARLFGGAPMGAGQGFSGSATGPIPATEQLQAPDAVAPQAGMPMPPPRPAGFGFGAPPVAPRQAAPAAPQSSAIVNPPQPPIRPFGALPTPEADMPAVGAVPTAGTMPAPAAPAAAESSGFSIGDIFRNIHSSGADDTLIGLGTGLMSTRGFGNGLAAGFQNAQKYGAQRSATDLARAELALKTGKLAREAQGQNATAQAIATKLGIPLDQAQGFASNPTFVSDFLKGQYGASEGFARGADGTLKYVPGGPQDPNTIRQQTAAKEPSLERVEAQASAQSRGAAAGKPDDTFSFVPEAERVSLGLPAGSYQKDSKGKILPVNPTGQTINMGGEKAQDATVGKGYGEYQLEMATKGRNAGSTLNTLALMEQAMKAPGFYSGVGGEGVKKANQLLGALGVKDANAAKGAEVFDALSNKVVLDGLGGSLGPGVSNTDRDYIARTAPTLTQSEQGNRDLIGIARSLAQRQQAVSKLARDYAAKNGGRLDANFDAALDEYASQNPLFPAAKAAATATAPGEQPRTPAALPDRTAIEAELRRRKLIP